MIGECQQQKCDKSDLGLDIVFLTWVANTVYSIGLS